MSTNIQNTKPIEENLDALIVGAGFSGVYQLHYLRKLGLSVRLFEAASDLGGTWYWNCYPGARVDSEFSVYQFSIEELWRDWNWTERFPDWTELREYFRYVDKKLDLSRDITFNTRVVSAEFNSSTDRWAVTTHNGTIIHPRFLVLCTGFSSIPYIPNYKGLDTFRGIWSHTGQWPQEGIDLKNKRVGVIGTGASGVQVIQEAGQEASHLTVFQRTPNLAIPMKQYKVDRETQAKMKEELYQHILRRRPQTFAGFSFDLMGKNIADISPEEVAISFEELWEKGSLQFWLGGYPDALRDQHVNDIVYAFWRKKVLDRIHDPEMQRKLAPAVAPHPIGVKRISLEQNYYEVYNQSNVTLIDIHENPIVEISPKGVITGDGVEHELDILILATGFDAVTGGIKRMDIRGTDGIPIRDKWEKGLKTYLGLMTTNFPNMFFPYGPQGPTAFCNGPTCAEIQGSWIVNCIHHLQKNSLTRIVPTTAAEEEWVKLVNDTFSTHLWSHAKSWYTGANIPGKVVESLNFTGGLPLYNRICRESAERGFQGFTLTSSRGERSML